MPGTQLSPNSTPHLSTISLNQRSRKAKQTTKLESLHTEKCDIDSSIAASFLIACFHDSRKETTAFLDNTASELNLWWNVILKIAFEICKITKNNSLKAILTDHLQRREYYGAFEEALKTQNWPEAKDLLEQDSSRRGIEGALKAINTFGKAIQLVITDTASYPLQQKQVIRFLGQIGADIGHRVSSADVFHDLLDRAIRVGSSRAVKCLLKVGVVPDIHHDTSTKTNLETSAKIHQLIEKEMRLRDKHEDPKNVEDQRRERGNSEEIVVYLDPSSDKEPSTGAQKHEINKQKVKGLCDLIQDTRNLNSYELIVGIDKK